MTVAFESTAHEELPSHLLDVKDDRKWNVYISEKVNVVGVSNVVGDETACLKRLVTMIIVVMVAGIVAMVTMLLRMDRKSEDQAQQQQARLQTSLCESSKHHSTAFSI
ncbi:MAG: hypothetical protein ACPGYK_07300 [Flavobacteriales bacterium]